ncbi:urease accessory protein UreF [Telmatospirillum siberiense]|uniref:Urease accessory protein UreF n=1 Tax=Telmatospirillum siberiense TaxID=382514 RepID=A0A2N3PTJ0_9PROT|nr:urease accessory UreF family protein [Telmatospirillum siberiense]PKU23707.1 urease accessory protein UreF [Telmatospirillum siberiense]
MPDAGATTTDNDGLLRLMSWLSPAFPIGSFSYSHGLEQAVEAGLLTDLDSVTGWVAGILRHGGAWIDAVLFCQAHRAVRENAPNRLAEIFDLAEAWRGTAETALESRSQGKAFVKALSACWPSEEWDRWMAGREAPAYAVAVAVAAAAAGIAEEAALAAFLHAVAANLVSAAVRLVPLGQTDGQKAVRALVRILPEVVAAAAVHPLADLGTATPMVDWASMRHETQYTRLFRS